MKTIEMLSYEDSRDASGTPNPCLGGGSPVRTRFFFFFFTTESPGKPFEGI